MGESRPHGRFFDRWRVRRDGTLVFAETLRLDGDIAAAPGAARDRQWRRRRRHACSSFPATKRASRRSAPCEQDFAGEVGVSAWNGLALARLVAPDGAALRRDLVGVLTALAAEPLPRLWLN